MKTGSTLLRLRWSLLTVTAALATTAASAADLTLNFANVPDKPGDVMIAVYDSEATFREKAVTTMKVASKAGQMDVKLALPPGEYAVMVFHDQNGDGKLNTNLVGIPKEPWAGSTGSNSFFGAPKWEHARFALPDQGSAVKIDFK